MNIKEILLELIKDAKSGEVKINDISFLIGFNTNIEDSKMEYSENNISSLYIRNLDTFVKKIEDYLDEENKHRDRVPSYIKEEKDKVKFLMMYLFVNATSEDFLNPERYIDRYIGFLKDNTFSLLNEKISVNLNNIFENETLEIKNNSQSVCMETPNKIQFSITSKENSNLSFVLPEISYGICKEDGHKVCYIYSILNRENLDKVDDEELLRYKKVISRKLYKLNSGISAIDSDYEENIKDVSVSSVLSLYLFLNLLKGKVDKVRGVSYLPIRYVSRDNASETLNNESRKQELKERNDNIQRNVTDKFIRTFRRVEVYMDQFSIDTYPYEIDEYINCSFKDKKKELDNEVISSFSK